MLILGIESSCDDTGVALYDTVRGRTRPRDGLLAQALHSQVRMHQDYGGVVPELASRDHIRRVIPLARRVLDQAQVGIGSLGAIACTQGPGLAGALLVGAGTASGLAFALGIPMIPVHHLEGHLLSPLLSADPPAFPFVALLVSGGHTQLLRVSGLGEYALLGESVDDAAGEAFDKSAKLLGLGYPGGPALSELARQGVAGRFRLPRPMLANPTLEFSFSGLKTAVSALVRQHGSDAQARADLAHAVEDAIVDVLTSKSIRALEATGLSRLVIAGGVSANRVLRERLDQLAARRHFDVYYPELSLCTDNGAMIAFAAAGRVTRYAHTNPEYGFEVRPRWSLESIG